MGKFKELWTALTTPDDESEMTYCEALALICGKCKCGPDCCENCPVKISSRSNMRAPDIVSEGGFDDE